MVEAHPEPQPRGSAVLEVTDSAASMIRRLIEQAELPTGGLRIAQRDDHPALAMRLTGVAEPDDVVLSQHDATVFLGPIAAHRLAGQRLDARANDSGTSFFLDP